MTKRLSLWSWFWLALAAIYFLLPLYGSLEFSLETGPGKYGLDAYRSILNDPMFKDDFLLSLKLALATVAITTVLMVPTVYWIDLKLPRLRPVMEFLSVLPFVVPPVALALGVLRLFHSFVWLLSGPQILVLVYVVLALPFTYRSLDAGLRAIDLQTLNEAGLSLGAGQWRILFSVIVPNLRFAVLSAALLTFTLVMGEYTIAAFMLFNTFAIYVEYIGETQANPAAALAMISLAITWLAMFGILFLGRGIGRRQVHLTGAR